MNPLLLLSKVWIQNPYAKFDSRFAQSVINSGAFPIIYVSGKEKNIDQEILHFSKKIRGNFGLQFDTLPTSIGSLPKNLELVILPSGAAITEHIQDKKIVLQITSPVQLDKINTNNIVGIIAKGNESAGLVDEFTSFILLQTLLKKTSLPIWVQGGIGLHSAPALIGIGASGVMLDYQCTFFPEMSVNQILKDQLSRLEGSETRIINNQRVYYKPSIGQEKKDKPTPLDISQNDLEAGAIYLSKDIGLARHYHQTYGNMHTFIHAIKESIHACQKQAKHFKPLQPNNKLCQELGLKFPIAQGPMTRVSDNPQFTNLVATEGALPFVALSMLKGTNAKKLLTETRELLKEKAWGVGLLGFNTAELWNEQLSYLSEAKPNVVIIAGGRPSQAKQIEALGIKTFLHAPSTALLDNFLEQGFKNFVFEGYECGGHVGPFSSLVLWQAQIIRLLKEDDLNGLNIFFAGGIHDAVSAKFISIMAAPLVARGVNIGVIIGTAYLFTKEIVESGAIQKQFQSEAINDQTTTLLETAPGHVIRCLKTPFTEYFSKEKERLINSGLSARDIASKLDDLNIGRLRIASKGVERVGNKLIPLNADIQLDKGLYMIGQTATLTQKTQRISDLHKNVSIKGTTLLSKLSPQKPIHSNSKPLDIAIVGMACVFPGAKNLDEYWLNILDGKDSIEEIPTERWDKDMYFSKNKRADYKSTSKWGGFIPEITFDPIQFGIPPQSLASIDPGQLLSLQVAYDALVDAGYQDKYFDRENTSVIFGTESGSELNFGYELRSYFSKYFGEIPDELNKTLPKLTEDSFPGVLANVVSGRIANRLDFGGRNYAVDAACASSLTAVDLACQELRTERANVALAGAVDLHNDISDYIKFSSAGALTFEGRCKTFDETADGITLGEGVAVLVLKRLDDAINDKDKIYSVIKSVGASSDGKSLGLTAPRKKGQLSAFKRAYKEAGISPSDIGLYEAHGTGTVVGDKTELSSITELMNQSGATPGQSHIGSVKTQIGHTKCAAGLAALIKSSLSVYHGIKPPTINLNKPNKYYSEAISPFTFNRSISPWFNKTRISGISAFGFGGTNFHTVIQNHNSVEPNKTTSKKWPVELTVFRGDSDSDLNNRLIQTRDLIQANEALELIDIAHTLSSSNSKQVLMTIVATSTKDLLESIKIALNGNQSSKIYKTQKTEGKIAFLFPGQGSQRINMARDLFSYFPNMRTWLNSYENLEKILFPNQTFTEATLKIQKEEITKTINAQSLLGVTDMAIAELLKSLGIVPDMVAGHSYGEIPALCYAGVIDKNDLVEISKNRAESILGAIKKDSGSMLAVSADKAEVLQLLETEKGIDLANHNSKKQCVVAGNTININNFADRLKSLDISCKILPVACAFHSSVVSNSKALFKKALTQYRFNKLTQEVWSNTTAKPYPTTPSRIKETLTQHLTKPVLFVDQIQAMHNHGARVFIESGPGKVLSNLTKDILGPDVTCLNVEQENTNGIEKLMHFLAGYIATGRKISFSELYEHRNPNLVDFSDLTKNLPSKTAWKINGQRATPIHGNISGHAVVSTTPTIALNFNDKGSAIDNPTEGRVQEYLQNINTIVKAQHEVMLNYLGKGESRLSQVDSVTQDKNSIASKSINQSSAENLPKQVKTVQIHEDIASLLLKIISEKTGYPIDMLDTNMDLEADLSIDSIKRIEIINTLRKNINIEDTNNGDIVEKLSPLKTIKGLIDCLNELTQNNTKEEATTSTVEMPNMLSKESLKESILSVVSNKTGYPIEMLDMTMDLEADLSIDSIKRIEIINQIKKEIGGFGNGANDNQLVEKLATLKNLDSMLTMLHDHTNGKLQSNNIEVLPSTIHKETPVLDFLEKEKENVLRYRIDKVKSAEVPIAPEAIKDKRFAIIEDGNGIAEKVKSYLEYYYAQADIISSKPTSLHEYDGLILINLQSNGTHTNMMDYVALLGKLDHEKTKWIIVAHDQRNELQFETNNKSEDLNQGFQGLLNSLNKEWAAQCKTIHFCDRDSIKNISNNVVDELLLAEDNPEVFYIDEDRHIGELKQIHWDNRQQKLSIEKEDVVLVLGGAQGITSEIIKNLSNQMPATYILVGRSPSPSINEYNITSTDKNVIREQLIQRRVFKAPKELDKAINDTYKNNQILLTLSTIEENGSNVEYHSIDVTHQEKLANLLDHLYDKYGRLDGVIHAAGSIDDRLFLNKTAESFKKVYDIKVLPLKTLIKHLRKQTKFCVLFSSIASVAGNKGQTDYAAANSVLDQGSHILNHHIDGRVLAINWGPWQGGTGMIDEGLENDFKRRGIATIPLIQGAGAFIKELKYGTSSQVVIMTQIEALSQV